MTDVPEAAAPAKVRLPIWDLPTRLFHWIIVVLFAFSWWTAENDRPDLHIWSGLAILTLLVFRILWGFVGSSTARFANFVRGPRAVFGYLRGNWSGIGHNPLGAISVIAVLGLLLVQVGLGLISTDDDGLVEGPLASLVSYSTSDWAVDLHESLFNVLLAFIGLHVAAILVYRLRGKGLIGPMLTGKGVVDPGMEPMRRGKTWGAILCLLIAIAITRWIVAGAPPFS